MWRRLRNVYILLHVQAYKKTTHERKGSITHIRERHKDEHSRHMENFGGCSAAHYSETHSDCPCQACTAHLTRLLSLRSARLANERSEKHSVLVTAQFASRSSRRSGGSLECASIGLKRMSRKTWAIAILWRQMLRLNRAWTQSQRETDSVDLPRKRAKRNALDPAVKARFRSLMQVHPEWSIAVGIWYCKRVAPELFEGHVDTPRKWHLLFSKHLQAQGGRHSA